MRKHLEKIETRTVSTLYLVNFYLLFFENLLSGELLQRFLHGHDGLSVKKEPFCSIYVNVLDSNFYIYVSTFHKQPDASRKSK